MSRRHVNLSVFITIFVGFSILTVPSYAQSKAEYFKQKVKKGHDFTKIDKNVKYKSDRLIVRFASKESGIERKISEKRQILNSVGGASIKQSFKKIPGLTVVDLPPGQTVEDAIKLYNVRNDILYAEPDYEIKFIATEPNDTRFDELWGMHNTGQTGGTTDADIDAPEAWDIRTDANDIIIAVIDSGVDYTHPDLAANIWINPSEEPNDANNDGYPGIAGVDDDGDGLIDEDSNGTSRFLADGETEDPNWTNDLFEDDDENGYVDDIYGYDFGSNDSDPNDYYFHGTHCAGTIGAVGNNNEGVAGVCWKARMMVLNIDTYPFSWGAWTSNGIEAIKYAVDNGAKVLSNSWRIDAYSQSMKEMIEYAEDADVLFVAASGNDSLNTDISPHYPSSYDLDNIISVLATDHRDTKSGFSNYGLVSVDLGAPGTDILSTFPTNLTPAMAYYGLSTDYETISGTSMATPHVAGACALLWAEHPDWSYYMVKETILGSVDKLFSLNGLCVSGGRLNLHEALLAKPPFLSISVEDDFYIPDPNNPPCGLEPNNLIVYTINYSNPQTDPCAPDYLGTAYDVSIVDYLPPGVFYVDGSADPNDGVYNSSENTYTWYIGTLDPGDSGTATLTVRVNEMAEPLGEIKNEVIIESEYARNSDIETTPVCCWGGDVIYVNASRIGFSGTSWDDPYPTLQQALTRAAQGCGNEIWVAKGVYSAVGSPGNTYDLLADVALYGGFAGNETSLQQRNHLHNETYLSGQFAGGKVDYVVKAQNVGLSSALDGFIITNSAKAGIYCSGSEPNIVNCVIQESDDYGIHCDDSEPVIDNCLIRLNASAGIYCANGSDPNISRCIIRENNHGIKIDGSSGPEIVNSWIDHNSDDGIWFTTTNNSSSIIRNNTIVCNGDYGIYLPSGNPKIINCILWGNDYYNQISSACSPTYSCIDNVSPGATNIKDDPNFAYGLNNASNNYHLDPGSPCRDAGDSSGGIISSDELDIDGEDRADDGYVDMGADEVNCGDVSNELDFNADGLINFNEYARLANAWLSHDPNDPEFGGDPNDEENWDRRFDFDNDYDIDLADFATFCTDYWLWQACWRNNGNPMMMIMTMGLNNFGQQTMSGISFFMMSPDDIEQAKWAEWLRTRPKHELTIFEQLVMLDDILDWLDMLWKEDQEIRTQFSEDEWFDWMKSIYYKILVLERQYYGLDENHNIDLVDLSAFCDEWRWRADWTVLAQMMSDGGMETLAAAISLTPIAYYEIIFSDEQIADFIETYAWAAELFDDDDENVTMQAYITVDGVFYEVNKDRPDGSHVEIDVDASGKMLRHSTTDAQDRLTRFVAELLPDGGKVVFNVAYDDGGNKIVDEWIEYDSDGNMIEYWDLIAMEAEARQIAEEAGD